MRIAECWAVSCLIHNYSNEQTSWTLSVVEGTEEFAIADARAYAEREKLGFTILDVITEGPLNVVLSEDDSADRLIEWMSE